MGWVNESTYDPLDRPDGWKEDPPLLMAAPHRDWWVLRKYVEEQEPDYPVSLIPLRGRVAGLRARGFEVYLMGEPLTPVIREWIDYELACRVPPAYQGFHTNGIVRGRF